MESLPLFIWDPIKNNHSENIQAIKAIYNTTGQAPKNNKENKEEYKLARYLATIKDVFIKNRKLAYPELEKEIAIELPWFNYR